MPGKSVCTAVPSITFLPSYQSSMKPRSGFDDQITCMTKSCHTPRTRGVAQMATVPLLLGGFRSSESVSPFTSNSSGGEPQQPLWCHCVKTCHLFSLGYDASNIVLHA